MNKYNILLAGNPNVGKSSIFNILTGENQHTGNWIGKTVETKLGTYSYNDDIYNVYDLPGTYSLITTSYEEEVAVDFETGVIKNLTKNEEYKAMPFPEFIGEIIKKGGLLNSIK